MKQSDNITSGDICIVFSAKSDKFLGLGLYDAASPIRIKMLFNGAQKRFDPEYIKDKLEQSLKLRLSLFEITNAYRWIHGENDGMPGLIIDQYANVTVLKLYSEIWIPYLDWIKNAIIEIQRPNAIVLRLARSLYDNSKVKNASLLYGVLDFEEVTFQEYGVRFSANVFEGHKTGYFLDHRRNRGAIGKLASNKNVLDVFTYAGGFSIHALMGGAKKVVGIDISSAALDLAKKNAALNGAFKNYELRKGDAFEMMKEAIDKGEKYDLVVIDPPSFAKAQKDKAKALKAYSRLTSMGVSLVAPKGMLVMASCSSRIVADDFFETIEKVLEKSDRLFSPIEKTFHDVDHPITFKEGAYLKCGFYQLD